VLLVLLVLLVLRCRVAAYRTSARRHRHTPRADAAARRGHLWLAVVDRGWPLSVVVSRGVR
jgi:hypothetical protein